MSCKFKALGLMFLISTAAAALPGAAQAGSFDIAVRPAFVTGHSELQQLNAVQFLLAGTSGTSVEGFCNTVSLEGTSSEEQTPNELTLTPTFGKPVQETFGGCLFFAASLGISQIQMNGCRFTVTGFEQPANTMAVDIAACTAGKQMQIKGTNCTLDIPEQVGVGHLVSKNLEGGVVTSELALSSVITRQTGAACPDGDNHGARNLSMTTNLLLKAFRYIGNGLVTKHGHQYLESLAVLPASLTST